MTRQGTVRHGLGDPRIAWTFMLTARVAHPRAREDFEAPLADLYRRHGWPHAPAVEDARNALKRWSTEGSRGAPLRVACTGPDVLLGADHRHTDGLGSLRALGDLLGVSLTSSARGIGDSRPQTPLVWAGIRRLGEIVVRPSARIPDSTTDHHAPGDTFVAATIAGRVTPSGLAAATARAAFAAAGGRRPVSLAIGVSTTSAAGAGLRDNSAYLRIRNAERYNADTFKTLIATAPTQPGGSPGTGAVAAVARRVSTLAAGRLGSTVLISHLGVVDSADLDDLAVYSISGGASGLAMGAVTLTRGGSGAHTTLTLRGRAAQHSDDGLRRILEATIAELREDD